MASAIVLASAGHIGKLLTNEVHFLWNVKSKVERLEQELLMAASFLKDADSHKNNSSEVIRTAASKFRDLAYEAEDIIEKYCINASHRRHDEVSDSMIDWLCCLACNAKSLHEVGSDIDVLVDKLNDLTSQLQRYNILPSGGNEEEPNFIKSSSSSKSQLNRTFSSSEVDDTVGLVSNAGILMDQLAHDETTSLSNVIIISGMGGLGKSTLAKKVFIDPNVENKFELCAWVFVSQQFEETHVFRSILTRFFRNNDGKLSKFQNLPDDMLHGELHTILQNHKCLIILDDIWSLNDWNRLESAFYSIQTSPSKLVITTRNENLLVGMHPPAFLHQLQLLSEEDSRQLFLKKILAYRTEALGIEMKQLGDQMVQKCHGLPLAIVALSGILSNKKYASEWRDVLDNMDSYLNDDQNQSNKRLVVSKVLELSYNDLPRHLRLCFLHMATFPEDFQISVKKLLHLWEAENLSLLPTKEFEDVGRDYLNQLVQRCLVQVGGLTKSGRIKTCHLHDMMRDMCMIKAREENFLHVFEPGEGVTHSLNEIRRGTSLHRLAIHPAHKSSAKLNVDVMKDCTHLRSLMVFDSNQSEIVKSIDQVSPLLRVLDLEDVIMVDSDEGIKNLVHLRYLNLKNTNLRNLPPVIGNLMLLQTLDLRISERKVKITNEFQNMKRLVHLFLPVRYRCIDEKLRLEGLASLKTLVNLCPQRSQLEDVHALKNLESVSFRYDAKPLTEEDLVALASLSSKGGLKKAIVVIITGKMMDEDPHMMERFSGNPKINFSLCQLTLCSINNLDQLVLPSNLCVLILQEIEFEGDPMSALEKLPHLRCLALYICPHIKKMVCTKTGFPQLKILVLYRLFHFNEWKVEEGAMLNLTHLCIESCPGLRRKDNGPSHEIITIMTEAMMTSPRLESDQSGWDMKRLYKLCSIYQTTTEVEQTSSMIEDLLNNILSSGKLSLSDGKKILYWLRTSWEILDDKRVIIRPHGATFSYINWELSSFKHWTWTI